MREAIFQYIGEDNVMHMQEYIPYKEGTGAEDIKWFIDNISMSSLPVIYDKEGKPIKLSKMKVIFEGKEQILNLK